MLSLLPDFADPLRLCALGKRYEGSVPLADMPRLTPLLASTEGEAAFVLAFGRDADRRSTVQVRVEAELALQCQRCLGEMRHPVVAEATLVVVSGPDEAERLAGDVDPLIVEDDRVALRSLIEDELILAVPPAPVHPAEACKVKLSSINSEPEPAAEDEQRDNPFAALAGLKSDSNKQD